ncbi:carbohydrate ABC transporter permease [Pseudoclavibacter sp. RFBG4]|uniref:carbohydrate ABC transporter permease n=1 Tax=unclassified Pseudoclavibacter TaxID=2615177 RepID=UPI000CE934D0|nr:MULTISPECIES: carbohydrate ABC transporter permease [unclassified Pseudoclavibacter]MBF4551622.1 carbohydrate ABC transporter permease [Pseudoclavibacter sp. VKM Ac-2888]PPF78389.1 carbohydrate ABC transporter permease [Pseudoclavibacter sp. Z016]PPG01960.1 carbohydrate ABC transporter permease [Pseudoclavibacter sp. RFBI5]PPG26001.1 carbohydrate ABC transporter permease [Pseudoclavibacter sp. RFBG4]VXC11353.1 Carbohydrate ABC transporter permease [Pseudoclavibacter sp. 8L]
MFRYTKFTLIREVAVWLVAIVFLLPFYFLVITAFKSDQEVFSTSATELPATWTVENFANVMTATGQSNVLIGLLNSIIITGGTILCMVILGALAGYVITRSTRRWTQVSYYIFLIAIILPTQLGTVPLYMGARALGLTGSLWGMIVLYTGMLLPLAIFLYANFFRGLGTDYEEAAALDGASPTQVFFQIILPLMAPATGTVAILAGLIVWNDFFTSLIFLGGSDFQTLPVAMYYYVGALVSQWNQIFSIVIISMVPILIFYLVAQKQFMQGFAGGLKH